MSLVQTNFKIIMINLKIKDHISHTSTPDVGRKIDRLKCCSSNKNKHIKRIEHILEVFEHLKMFWVSLVLPYWLSFLLQGIQNGVLFHWLVILFLIFVAQVCTNVAHGQNGVEVRLFLTVQSLNLLGIITDSSTRTFPFTKR